jgi:hypothetical protein
MTKNGLVFQKDPRMVRGRAGKTGCPPAGGAGQAGGACLGEHTGVSSAARIYSNYRVNHAIPAFLPFTENEQGGQFAYPVCEGDIKAS